MRNRIIAFIALWVPCGAHDRCSMTGSSLNIYMSLHSGSPLNGLQTGTLESVYYHYPAAHVVILSSGYAFEDYKHSVRSKGYCLTIVDPAAHISSGVFPHNEFFRHQVAIYHLQQMHGGLYVPFDGALLNPVEYFYPFFSVEGKAVLQEIVTSQNHTNAFTKSEYIKLGNPVTDFRNNSVVCSVHCIRFIPKGSELVPEFLNRVSSGGHPDDILTGLIKSRLSTVIYLPFWLMAEPKFNDHWTGFGSSSGYIDSSTDWFIPRPQRFKYDYHYTVSHKMWLPWTMVNGAETNVFEKSIVALVRQDMSLSLFSPQFIPVMADDTRSSNEVGQLQFKIPSDQFARLMTPEELAIRKREGVEAGTVGSIGTRRFFSRIKLVSGSPLMVRVEIHAHCPGVLVGLTHPLDPEDIKNVSFDGGRVNMCGSVAVVNSLLSSLTLENRATDPHQRCIIQIQVVHVISCEDEIHDELISESLLLHMTDPIRDVTVIAHSGGRCDLLDRLIVSVEKYYPGVGVMVTCECAMGSTDCPSIPALVAPKSTSSVSWYAVPFDFGLSRGKQFLISVSPTAYTLVLDDDFVFAFNSCVECMVWRMQSPYHKPAIEIVGFPVLEDERLFGAFRGTMRVTDSRFFIEPLVRSQSADGCLEVDICPMVFLGRTSALRKFTWQPELTVGEHELFFYSNKPRVVVCADSAFIHHRPDPTSLSQEYHGRRSRQKDLMNSALSSIGVGPTYYFFHKYSHGDARDFEYLMSKGIHPHIVRDDSSDPKDNLSGRLRLLYITVLSGIDARSAKLRVIHRSATSPYSRIRQFGTSIIVFLLPSEGRSDPVIQTEQRNFNDILFVPNDGSEVKFVMNLLRMFTFYYFIMVSDSCMIDLPTLGAAVNTSHTVTKYFSGDKIRGLSRDLYAALSDPRVLPKLTAECETFECIDRWTTGFNYEKINLVTFAITAA